MTTSETNDSRKKYHEINECRVCQSTNLVKILSLGNQFISNYVDVKFDHSDDNRVPLDLVLCPEYAGGCGLLQSKYTASREVLYREYWFRSGLNEAMKSALKDITILDVMMAVYFVLIMLMLSK